MPNRSYHERCKHGLVKEWCVLCREFYDRRAE